MELSPYKTFSLKSRKKIPVLQVELAEYTHSGGARHLHLASKNRENVFMLALRTIPHDSTGIAHILEHTSLCGSKHYPVRDPFFMMLRRSLNTFMNAFTGGDWTGYPFSTCNHKDFNNLLSVYLDAVFFPRLDAMDFAQEGWRLEFEKPADKNTPLVYRGVVYNEMKGAMSSPSSQIHQHLLRHLFPTGTYRHNSGGDPEKIPDLDHGALVDFHKRHYRPDNATFMTFGNIAPKRHQRNFQEMALDYFAGREGEKPEIVSREKIFPAPRAADEAYAMDKAENNSQKNHDHILMAWLLGDTINPEEAALAQLLSDVLMGNSASPLQRVLEGGGLGAAPSSLCGVSDEQRELVFVCGVEGADRKDAEKFERKILAAVKKVAREGVPREEVEAALHQFELRQRSLGEGRLPYGLQLLLNCLPAVLYEGAPHQSLDLDAQVKDLHRKIKDPSFFPALVKKLLLENPHRLRLTARADTRLADRQKGKLSQKLKRIKAGLDEKRKKEIIAQAKKLDRRQRKKDDPEVLPYLSLADVPKKIPLSTPRPDKKHPRPAAAYACQTFGLAHQQLVLPVPELSPEQIRLLPLYLDFITKTGVGGRDYLQTQHWQTRVSGGIGAGLSLHTDSRDSKRPHMRIYFASYGLRENAPKISDLLTATLQKARFDEHKRVRDLLGILRLQMEEGLVENAHVLAMHSATRNLSPAAALRHNLGGLAGLKNIIAVDETFKIKELSEKLQEIHTLVSAMPVEYFCVAEKDALDGVAGSMRIKLDHTDTPPPVPLFPRTEDNELWLVNTQVNYCAKTWPAVPKAHPDAPALTVLATFLRHGFLHRAVREQGGAYGGGALYDREAGAFCCYSYRDPRLAETLEDFDNALRWLKTGRHGGREREESILSIISALDAPKTPATAAKAGFYKNLYGDTPELARRFRRGVLSVQMDDVIRVAEAYLAPQRARTAVVAPLETPAVPNMRPMYLHD